MGRKFWAIDNNTKHIAFFIESLALGGIGRITLALAGAFADMGYKVDLVLAKKQGHYLTQVSPGINLIDIKARRLIFSTHLVGAYLKEARPDVFISANERVNIIALLARKFYSPKTKLIISIHTNNSAQIRNQGASLYRSIVLKAARLVYKWADEVVAVSQGVAVDACRLFNISGDRIKVIYNPLVSSEITYKMKKPVDHSWLIQSEFPVILGIGRLVAPKDFLTLIDSFSEVRKTLPEARLIILGEGGKRKVLENKVCELGLKDLVSLPGFVDNPYSYMYHSSVFVLSSAWEGLPNALVEAMATGTPVVSTDCPSGPSEILDNGKYGVLVPVGDANALARAILAVLKNPPDPERLINRANDFTVDKAVEKYLDLINDLQKG